MWHRFNYMKIIDTKIPEVKIIEPNVFGDERGFFLESFQKERYRKMLAIEDDFVQDNMSRSKINTLRGLHYQVEHTQGKLVSVMAGRVYDVAVDVRIGSPTFKQWVGAELTSDNKRQLWVPKGFAHGFLVLSEIADFYYKCTDYYHNESEQSIKWDDVTINVEWPLSASPVLSKKDELASSLADISEELLPRYKQA